MGKRTKRVSTEGSSSLSQNPFGELDIGGLPDAPDSSLGAGSNEQSSASPRRSKPKNRGRIDVSRQKAGRGGKTVTVVTGFKGIGAEEKQSLAKTIQKRCGVGGAVKGGNLEIQGDKREEVKAALEEAGFHVVFVGG